MGWLEGNVAVVTGAASGIGRAVVRRYIAEGAAGVSALDRNGEALADLAAEFPGKVVATVGDVRDYAPHQQAVAAAIQTFGKLDTLVGNAGIFDFHRPLASYTPDALTATLDEVMAINVRGYLYSAMAAREALIASRGAMIFTASVASLHAGGGGVAYTLSKHAVAGVIHRLAYELAPDVRVNGVGPGGTLTNLSGAEALGHRDRSVAARAAETEARMIAHVPLKAAQRPEDHAGLYVLLASRRDSGATTGELFMSDGGIGIRSL
jgi:cis-3,4-dihydrophenanthrene-3,4-diol dehydrogenase